MNCASNDGSGAMKSLQRALGCLMVSIVLLTGCGRTPATEEATLERAEALQAAGAYDEMVALLEAFDERSPGSVRILEMLAFHHSGNEDHMLAAFYFSRLAEVDPAQAEYILYAATALRTAGDRPGAVRLYRQYLEQVPDNKGVWVILAELNELGGDSRRRLKRT
ncbi:MAG: tetratricopeptide repeat protein [Verrucomicrobia bacterium]|nr:tetratricopeptide repeat protein [Verrucomicrobiota bacterium]